MQRDVDRPAALVPSRVPGFRLVCPGRRTAKRGTSGLTTAAIPDVSRASPSRIGEGFSPRQPRWPRNNRAFGGVEFRQIGAMLQCDFKCGLCLIPALRICIVPDSKRAMPRTSICLVQHHFRSSLCRRFRFLREDARETMSCKRRARRPPVSILRLISHKLSASKIDSARHAARPQLLANRVLLVFTIRLHSKKILTIGFRN